MNASAGLTFQKSFFTWNINAAYDFIPFTMNKPLSEQIFYGTNNFVFGIDKVKLSFPARIGRKKLTALETVYGKEKQTEKTETVLSQGVRLDFFLIDTGFFKVQVRFPFVPTGYRKSNFFDYGVSLQIPAVLSLYYADLAFMYSFYHTDRVQTGKEAQQEYEIEKSQTSITFLPSFKAAIKYRTMHIFGTELRWYAARTGINANGFFLSLFADAGFGISKENKVRPIAEYGLGIGYNLLDNIPFTFQAGLNQSLEPVFFLGIVSRIIHIP